MRAGIEVRPERPVLRYFGSKWMLAPWILRHLPPHRIYVEPFGGGASVLMRKPRVYAEVYNDLDGEIVNVFRVLRDQASDLERILRLTPFARDEFNLSYEDVADPVERARRTLIRAYMGFGSNGHNPEERTGFRANSNRSNTTGAEDWMNYPVEIARFCARLQGVVIENKDALEVMLQQDSPETLHFLDPPYPHDTRGCTRGYRYEMSDECHERLCEFIRELQGRVVLCGYENPIYARLGWHTVRREAFADGARDRIEVLWMNPAAQGAQTQPDMFAEVGA